MKYSLILDGILVKDRLTKKECDEYIETLSLMLTSEKLKIYLTFVTEIIGSVTNITATTHKLTNTEEKLLKRKFQLEESPQVNDGAGSIEGPSEGGLKLDPL